MNKDNIIVSVVIPIKDEAANIEPLAKELTAILDLQPWSWECIWVDDGSTDESLVALDFINREEPRHCYISFDRHAGQSAALWAGFQESTGAILATIDGDGQNDPSDIPRLVKMIRSGKWDMINGYRYKRHDTLVRKISSRIANTFKNWITGKTVRDVGCSTRVFWRECVESLPQYKGMHRFLPNFVAIRGYRITEVEVNHRPRQYGKTKYSINNRLWVGLIDTFGVLWLQKRAFHYTINKKALKHSDGAG
ncbi:MAG: glycosyltransferase family 2 protein [Deltaproteobacteria bacterium]|nr:glycosyltransferase family 2 protein [Deltaproteobacteria bacterium]